MEVQRIEYKFSSLESYDVSLAKRKILSSFNLVKGKDIVDILKVFFEKMTILVQLNLR